MQSYFHLQADWHAVARDVVPCDLWLQELELQGKSSITTFAPYMRLPRCQRCFRSLVAERQEGWALHNEMMKPSTHLSGNSSMKYWSDWPSSLLWTDQCLGCSWSLLGEDAAVMVQIGIAYTDLVSDRFCNACPHWPGACLQGPNHLFKSPPLLLFLQIVAEINPVRWCKYLLLGPLVSPEMLRKENWDFLF